MKNKIISIRINEKELEILKLRLEEIYKNTNIKLTISEYIRSLIK